VAQEERPAEPRRAERWHLLTLLDSPSGLGILLLVAGLFGAAHALTPGHGKALVAAYLIGERGTAWHALLLGLVVTVTHTGVVIVVAAVLPLLVPNADPNRVQAVFGFVGGLLIAGLGFWLLWRRLAGQADHVHVGGGHHHHHSNESRGLPPNANEPRGLPPGSSWRGLVWLGVSGGIVPCWDAVVLLGLAVATQRLWLGLPLLLAFSAGLAAVLVALGVAVVSLKGVAAGRWAESRVVKALPVVSAVTVTAIGLWLCRDSLR
jgi:nickel/cobalt transporter (NicO) family protein